MDIVEAACRMMLPSHVLELIEFQYRSRLSCIALLSHRIHRDNASGFKFDYILEGWVVCSRQVNLKRRIYAQG
jgi:hypothetical protein